jgi:hypothetical protein
VRLVPGCLAAHAWHLDRQPDGGTLIVSSSGSGAVSLHDVLAPTSDLRVPQSRSAVALHLLSCDGMHRESSFVWS